MNSKPTKKQAWFGWCMYDWANSAFATVVLSAVLPVYFVALLPDEKAWISFFRFSRSFFSGLIPEGQHAEFCGFCAISAKFSSVLGPFVIALIVDITESARLSILALTFFFVTGMLILSRVKEEKQLAAAPPTL